MTINTINHDPTRKIEDVKKKSSVERMKKH